MQDRSPPARRNLLQRTAGPYIGVKLRSPDAQSEGRLCPQYRTSSAELCQVRKVPRSGPQRWPRPASPSKPIVVRCTLFPEGHRMAMPAQDCKFGSAKRSALVARVLLAVIFTAGVHPGLAQKSAPPKHLGILANWACPERLVPEMPIWALLRVWPIAAGLKGGRSSSIASKRETVCRTFPLSLPSW